MTQVRIGLVGGGWMGKAHAKAFLNVLHHFGEDYGVPKFSVVSDINEASALEVKEQFNFKRYTADWREVITDPEIDLIDIATPNFLHYEIAKEALLFGKHVYCEKPLSLTYEQSKELAELAEQRGLTNYVGYNNVMNPATQYMKELVHEGSLGEITKISGTYDQDALLDKDIPISWRHKRELAGSGTLGDLASHLFSVLQYVVGDFSEVSAVMNTFIKERCVSRGSNEVERVENDDVVAIIAMFKNGAIGTLSSSRIAAGRKNNLQIEIQGTKGSLYYSLENLNDVHVYFCHDKERDRGFRKVLLGMEHEGYSAFHPASGIAIGFNDFKILEAREVLSSITQNKPYVCNFRFGANVDRVIAAILQAAETNEWVEIID